MTKPLVKMIGAFGLVLGGCGSAHQAVFLVETHGLSEAWVDVATPISRFAISRFASSGALDRFQPECGREGFYRMDTSKEVGHAG